jgi:hypothetical protein
MSDMKRSSLGALCFSGLVLLAPATPVGAQDHAQHQHTGTPPERLGTVHFETSCQPAVTAAFDRAVALLHSFWFGAATDAFKGVAATDPNCAMAWWGVAMSHWGNPFGSYRSPAAVTAGREAWMKATATMAKASPREQAYIAAVGELYKEDPNVDQRTRFTAYERAMAAVQSSWPDDSEAKLFYVLALNQSASPADKTYKNQLAAADLLEKLAPGLPDHPGIAHYLIHSYDYPALAARGLDAARRYAKIAPDVPHALHMPSHTFTRVGYWQESIDTNLASAEAARREGSSVEELHALDYQAYAYLQTAQDRPVAEIVARLDALAARVPGARPDAAPIPAGYYAVAAIPARYALERGDWKAASQLAVRPSAFPWTDALTHFARALGAARSGQPEAARADIARLTELHEALQQKKEAYWAQQVDIQRRSAQAWALFAEGKKDEALRLMREAADLEDTTEKAAVTPGPLAPARELLAEMLLEAGRPADALVAFEATTVKEPNRFRGLTGAARAAAQSGAKAKAAEYAARLLANCTKADRDARPELAELRKLAN